MRLPLKLIIAVLLLVAALPVVGVAAQATGPHLVVNTSFMNVRSGPGAEFSSIVVVPGGTELPVLGIASDGVWYLVNSPGGPGWVNVEFTLARGDFRLIPEIDSAAEIGVTIGSPAAPTGGQGGGGGAPVASGPFRFRARVLVQTFNLLDAPDDGNIIATVFANPRNDYEILNRTFADRNIEWVQIHVPNVGIGWIETPKTFTALDARYKIVLTVVGEEVAVSAQPGGAFLPNLLPLEQNDEVFFNNYVGDMTEVELRGGQIGYVPSRSVERRFGTTTDLLAAQFGYVGYGTWTGGALPAGSSNSGQGGGGGTGVSAPTLAVPIAIINTGNLNVRSGPGPEYNIVGVLPGGSSVSVIGKNGDGSWFLVAGEDFGEGWLDQDFVIFRGDFRAVPILN